MLNQVILVGRLVKDPELVDNKSKSQLARITLAVPRNYKNADGIYETDFINCTLWQLVAANTKEYCKKGDIVGVKGRIETNSYEKDGEKVYTTNVIAERVTFLSSNKTNENKTLENEEE